jgi:hypothetical protein
MAKQPTKQRPVVGDQRTWARPRRLWAIVDDQPDADSAIKHSIREIQKYNVPPNARGRLMAQRRDRNLKKLTAPPH